jgi:hypothetical protein
MRLSQLRIVGCASVVMLVVMAGGAWAESFRDLKEVKMTLAEIKPPPATKRQVVVLPFGKSSVNDANISLVSDAAQAGLENVVMSAGAVVVDRSLHMGLIDEIQLLEQGGQSGLIMEGATDTVKGMVTSAGVMPEWTAASSWTDKKGRTYRTEANCKWTAEVRGRTQIYSMNPLSLRKTLYFGGQAHLSKDTNNSSCPISDAESNELLLEATRDAAGADCTMVALRNEFALVGYVNEYRKKKKSKNYFRTTLKKVDGAIKGEKANILRQEMEVDLVTGTETLGTFVVASGPIVIDDSGKAWIRVKKIKDAKRVQAGDLVRLEANEAGFAKKIASGGVFGLVAAIANPLLGVEEFDACAAVK